MARSLAEWLDWQTSIHPRTIELGLDRMRALLARLPVARPAGPVILVAGTNGKGSVAAYLEAVQAASGLKVGTYTSPHLGDYNERIRIAGRPIATEALCEAFEIVEAARGELALTFFEYGTAAALVAFTRAAVDAWVLEVGLGGRLDAVNAIDGDASVVVSIGLDHTDWLGPDVESIGREKAGIFRPGRPAVLGSRDMPASVAGTARERGATLLRLGEEYDARPCPAKGPGCWTFTFGAERVEGLPAPSLPGAVQRDNAAAALAALASVGRLPAHGVISRALVGVELPGRFQRLVDRNGVEWVLDVAHNPAAAAVLAQNLRALPVTGRTFAVIGILADKDAAGVGAALKGAIDAYLAVGLEGERGRDAHALVQALQPALGAPLAAGAQIDAALAQARSLAQGGDRVVVLGSFHVVGPALQWLRLYLKSWS